VPRRPSAKLKRKLFPARLHIPELPSGFGLGWLVPATAALLLTGVLVNQHIGPAASSQPDAEPLVATIMSNQSAAAYFTHGFQREQNALPADTFQFTNGAGFTSSIHSLWAPRVNRNQ
jgi:hypothetical protein